MTYPKFVEIQSRSLSKASSPQKPSEWTYLPPYFEAGLFCLRTSIKLDQITF